MRTEWIGLRSPKDWSRTRVAHWDQEPKDSVVWRVCTVGSNVAQG